MVVCPSSGGENPDNARFYLHCASPIVEAEPRRKERKYTIALFADLVGSTSLAEREDPEVVQSVVGRTFDRLSEEIRRHEGFLEIEVDRDRAIEHLRSAVGEFERLGLRIMEARVLGDLGDALGRAGQDPRPALERAHELLVEGDARIYLPEVDALLASSAAER